MDGQVSAEETKGIVYSFETRPDTGSDIQLMPGLRWLRMPLPFMLGHINLWLARDTDGWVLVDTGLYTEETVAAWEHFIARHGEDYLTRVVVTHMHPDHAGMAGWLCQRLGLELTMTATEYLTCRVLAADTGSPAPDVAIEFYRQAGYDEDQIARYKKRFGMFGKYVSPLPPSFRRIRDQDTLEIGGELWRIMCGRGHSPEHACLFSEERNVLISGDQILPTISSNISVWPTQPHANPLADWLTSCVTLRRDLPEDVVVLPAHGKPFTGAHERLTALIREHELALEKLQQTCSQPRRAVDVFAALFKSEITPGNLLMATGEALAHINYLIAIDDLSVDTDDNGVRWYQAI